MGGARRREAGVGRQEAGGRWQAADVALVATLCAISTHEAHAGAAKHQQLLMASARA
jgi:hypothetical protein